MGSLKLEQNQKVENDQERGQEITETGEQKIEEAETSAQALESIEAIDDDDKAAVDAARREAYGIDDLVAISRELPRPSEEIARAIADSTTVDDGLISIDPITDTLNVSVDGHTNFEEVDRNFEECDSCSEESLLDIEGMVKALEDIF